MSKDNLAIGSVGGQVYTSPHTSPDLDPEPALLAMINAAKHSIVFSTYSWTLPDLAQAIIAKHKAGLTVRGVADRSQYGSKNSQYPTMVAAGVDIRVWGSQFDLAHEKVLIVDGDVVALGSFNLTTSAEKVNREVLLILAGKQVSLVLAPTLATQIGNTYALGSAPPT